MWHDGGVSGRSRRTVVALAAAPVALAAVASATSGCTGSPAVERGFGSRQLVNLRDSTFTFNGSYGNAVYYSTGGGSSSAAVAYFSVDTVTGQVMSFGSSFPTVMPTTPPPFTCGVSSDSTSTSPHWIITNTQTDAQTTIDNYAFSIPECPDSTDTPLVVWRYDDQNHLTVWTGPFAALEQVPLPLVIDQFVVLGQTSATVLAATPDAPDAHGLYTIDTTTFATTNVVPAATTTDAWAPGAVEAGSLASATLTASDHTSFLSQVVPLVDHYIYPRTMSDGGTTMFAGPFPSAPASELALFPVPDLAMLQPIGVYATPLSPGGFWLDPAWRVQGPVENAIAYWHDATQRLITCPLPAGAPWMSAMGAPDLSRVLFQPLNSYGSTIMSGPLELATFDAAGGGGCTAIATADVTAASFSPDGNAMFWLSSPSTGDATLWAAAGDGSSPRTIGNGPIYASYPPHFVANTEIELTLGGDLAWIDLRDDPVKMHYVAEQVWGASIDFGDWLVADYDISGQDGTGKLAVIARTSGDKKLVSPEVAAFDAVGSYPPQVPFEVVYLVRGRNPSPQDGIWVATITDADLP